MTQLGNIGNMYNMLVLRKMPIFKCQCSWLSTVSPQKHPEYSHIIIGAGELFFLLRILL